MSNYAGTTGVSWIVAGRPGHALALTKRPVLQSQLCYFFTLAVSFMKSHLDSGNPEADVLFRDTRS